MAKLLSIVLNILLLFGRYSNGLELINGAYEDLVIKLSEAVPSNDCRHVLENLEYTLSSASQYLFSALNSRAYLRTATVLLPSNWPDSCVSRLLPGSGETPDVTVAPRGPTRGRIWTQQSLGCGQPGDQIYLSYESLRKRDNTLARSFVKEFAMYRYGVFEEQGYYNDPIYPMCYYDDENKTGKITGCSDLPINDDGICSGSKAEYNTTKMVDDKARSSIMFAAEAPSISMFCDEGIHDKVAPTKHNLICQHRSVLDVILSHSDFRDNVDTSPSNGQITNTTPRIVYKKQNITRYVFVIENNKDMMLRESWSYLKLAIRQFVSDLVYKNIEAGMILANEFNAPKTFELTSMRNEKNREKFYSSVPYTTDDSMQPACLYCGIKNATQMLNDRNKVFGTATNVIVVIAPGIDMNDKLSQLLKEVKKSKIRIATINYPALSRSQTLDVLAEKTNGAAYSVFEQKLNVEITLLTTYFELHNALYNVIQNFYSGSEGSLPMEIHRREIVDDGRSSVTGSFVVDPTMGEPSQFTFFTHNTVTPLIKSLKLTSPSHQVYDQWNDKYILLKMITIDANISESGTWTYVVESYPGNPQPHFIQVLATPKSAEEPVITARFWTHRNEPEGPLILLTEVKYGDMPILGAKVEVTVTKADQNRTNPLKNKFDLLDTGSGDPDITKGDGIYTRYFSAAEWGHGLYTFEVIVTDNGNTAYTWIDSSNIRDDKPCCGSVISPNGVQQVSPFQRVLPKITKLITLDQILNSNHTLAGKIGDLKVENIQTEMKARLSWTAPDMGGQSVSRYEIKYAYSAIDIIDKFETDAIPWDDVKIFPLSPGSETTCTIDLANNKGLLDKPLYFAIKAFPKNSDDVTGPISNWVRVFIASPPLPPTAPPSHTSNEQSYWPNQPNNIGGDPVGTSIAKTMNIGLELILPIAIGFILLVVLLVAYCYFCVVKRRDRNHKKPKKSSMKNDNNITIVPTTPQSVQNLPAYTPTEVADPHVVGVPINNYGYEDETKKRYSLVQQQEQQLIEELKQQQQFQRDNSSNTYGGLSVISNSTLPRNGQTLSPYNSWSASQLLHEHERRHSPMDNNMMNDEQMMIIDHMPYNGHTMDHMSLNHHMGQIPEHYIQGEQVYIQGHIPPPVPPLPNVNGYPANYSIYGTHPNNQINQQNHQIYQSMPRNEVLVPFNSSLQGSMSSVNSAEKKRRNVTMV